MLLLCDTIPLQLISESHHINLSMLMIKKVFIPMLFTDHHLNKSYLYAYMLIISSYISVS